MRTVRLRLRQADFSRVMIAMRSWLDDTKYEPTRFDCDQNGDVIILSVGFSRDAAAKAFAGRFEGEIAETGQSPSPAPARLRRNKP